MRLNLPWNIIEKLVQELAWRDYWQQVWIAKGDGILSDLKHKQESVSNHQVPRVMLEVNTGIYAIDDALKELYDTGYMHNHMRMYVASICCNMANSHWLQPAKWMYSHLLDGDIASNHLSWQWVAGAFSSKKYYANQNNINKYFNSSQKGTFLDVEYEQFDNLETPAKLLETTPYELETPLPNVQQPVFENSKTTLLYNYYNLDPFWHLGEDAQRILLLEPTFFKKYPVSKKCIDFVLNLGKNIEGLKVFVGDFNELEKQIEANRFIYKEHPTNKHYRGKEEPRDWLTGVTGYFPSFFAFWKKTVKELKP